MARAHYWSGDYQAALAVSRRLYDAQPDLRGNVRTLISALGQLGRAEDAQTVMTDAVQRFGEEFRTISNVRAQELREADREHLLEGHRKAGVID